MNIKLISIIIFFLNIIIVNSAEIKNINESSINDMRNFFKFYRLYEETHDKDKLIEIKNEILKYACEIDLNLSYKEGYFGEKNALTLACRNKHLDIVILLLNRGADVEERYFAEVHATMDYCYEISYTPLLWACSSGNLNLASAAGLK